jgi:hypothetical protein
MATFGNGVAVVTGAASGKDAPIASLIKCSSFVDNY